MDEDSFIYHYLETIRSCISDEEKDFIAYYAAQNQSTTDDDDDESIDNDDCNHGYLMNSSMEFSCSEITVWKQALSSYETSLKSIDKPKLIQLDDFYRNELPLLLTQRNPNPYISKSELSKLMDWKLTRGKWRPRLLSFVSSLSETEVKSASQKAFQSLPDVSKAVSELTVLKGIGPATASAVLAAYAPDVAPFMSDEAMDAVLSNSKDYTLKQYLKFTEKLQTKSKELSIKGDSFTPSDIERALWSHAIGVKLLASPSNAGEEEEVSSKKNSSKRKRKSWRQCQSSMSDHNFCNWESSDMV